MEKGVYSELAGILWHSPFCTWCINWASLTYTPGIKQLSLNYTRVYSEQGYTYFGLVHRLTYMPLLYILLTFFWFYVHPQPIYCISLHPLLHSLLVPSPLLLPLSAINSANTRTAIVLYRHIQTELFTSVYRT